MVDALKNSDGIVTTENGPISGKKTKKRSDFARWSIVYLVLGISMLLIDAFMLFLMGSSRKAEMEYEYERTAENVEYVFRNSIDYAAKMATGVSMSRELDEFLEETYENVGEYVERYQQVVTTASLFRMYGLNDFKLDVYADNDSLTNGGGIYKLDTVRDKRWYKEFMESGQDVMLMFYFDDDMDTPLNEQHRTLLYIRRFKYYKGGKYDKLCKIELNYSRLAENISSSVYGVEGFLCQNGYKAVDISGGNNLLDEYDAIDYDKIAFLKAFNFSGNEFEIVVPKSDKMNVSGFVENWVYVIILIVINLLFPLIAVQFVQAMQAGKLREQEMDIARQNAELLALHSQINPHFLFNALESIRMHSILRGETETAEMVENLAVIERKNADWNVDEITIDNEMDFTEAYLNLQRYRFGERLSYEIDVEEGCESIKIPKLTIVTFVENACVHGIEGKSSPGWIFVRVYTEKENLVIEVEDTGEGIDDDNLEILRDKMINASIDKLKEKGRIGIVNACLRLKIFTDNKVEFQIESEKNIGTTIQIFIPLTCIKE